MAGRVAETDGSRVLDPRALARTAERSYARVSARAAQLAQERAQPVPLALPPVTPSTTSQGFRELLERLREEGGSPFEPAVAQPAAQLAAQPAAQLAADTVLASLETQARAERSVEWLTAELLTAERFTAERFTAELFTAGGAGGAGTAGGAGGWRSARVPYRVRKPAASSNPRRARLDRGEMPIVPMEST